MVGMDVDMYKKLGVIFLLVVISSCRGKQNLQHLVKELKGESDKVANEIYSWIDQHKKGFETFQNEKSRDQSRDKSHDQPRDHSEKSAKERKQDFEHLIKNLKGESDHLANELYDWINAHAKQLKSHDHARDQSRDHRRNLNKHEAGSHAHERTRDSIYPRDQTYGQPRDQSRDFSRSKRDVQDGTGTQADGIKRDVSIDQPRDQPRGLSRDLFRSKRGVKGSSDGLAAESIQDVMFDLMNASPQKDKRINRKATISKAKINAKKPEKKRFAKQSKNAKPTKKTASKTSKKQTFKRVKRIKKNKITKKSKILKISKPKKRFTKHAPAKPKRKTAGLPDLLKVISADPAKKIVVTNKEDDVKIDKKSLKIINGIPKSVLKKLIKNINLEKYFKMASFLPEDVQKGIKKTLKFLGKVKGSKQRKKVILKKPSGKRKKIIVAGSKKRPKIKPAKVVKKSSNFAKKTKITKPRKIALKSSKIVKKKAGKILKVSSKGKLQKKVFNHGKGKTHSSIGHQKLLSLKEKIKKTNSLKLKVAKALLEHCETQNKLKKIFENVNASLKEASKLAQAIGKKFGVKQMDIDKLSTEHTEDAVAEFLDKIF